MPHHNRVTLADIARAAGVHVTTVSLALRNHPRLPPKTRARIRSLADQMGYTPDPMLRALASYRTQKAPHPNNLAIAYVTNWKTCWGWMNVSAHPEFYAGAVEKARELGFKLDHFWLGEPGLTHKRLNSMFRTRGITGLILASHSIAMGDELDLDWTRYCAVKIDYYPHNPPVHTVTNNQCDIARMAVKRVVAAGYRRIGFVMHRGWDDSADNNWTAGFLCEEQTLPQKDRVPPHIYPCHDSTRKWLQEFGAPASVEVEAFKEWIDRHRPEVILSKGAFVLPALEKLGLSIPRDIAFAELFLEDFSGATAGVRQNHTAVGALAVEILAGQLQQNNYGVPKLSIRTLVEGTWFDGASCPARASR